MLFEPAGQAEPERNEASNHQQTQNDNRKFHFEWMLHPEAEMYLDGGVNSRPDRVVPRNADRMVRVNAENPNVIRNGKRILSSSAGRHKQPEQGEHAAS